MLKYPARIVTFLAFALLGGAAGAGQEGVDMRLEDVGFVMRPATTPAQERRLKLLPPRQFVARTANGRRYYIYADPDYCKCAFVGGELAMKNYHDLVSPPPLAPATVGPGGPPSVTTEMIQEVDPGFDVPFGDIFDFPD
jgi:hypothetical protein